MGVLSIFAKPKKMSAAEYAPLPAYKPSDYDQPSSKQLYDTYSGKARGEGVGMEPGDLSLMRAQEIDSSVRGADEVARRSMAGRRGTGGVTTGGTNRIRERALLSTSVAKSQALRDIAIRNAVLKREETWQGVQGLDGFLQNERGEAWRKTSYEADRTRDSNANARYGQDITNQNRGIYNQWMNDWLNSVEDRVAQGAMMAAGGGSGAAGAGAAKGGGQAAAISHDQQMNPFYTNMYRPPQSLQNYRR